MNEGIHLDLDTWIVPGQIRKANLCRFKVEALDNYTPSLNLTRVHPLSRPHTGCLPMQVLDAYAPPVVCCMPSEAASSMYSGGWQLGGSSGGPMPTVPVRGGSSSQSRRRLKSFQSKMAGAQRRGTHPGPSVHVCQTA